MAKKTMTILYLEQATGLARNDKRKKQRIRVGRNVRKIIYKGATRHPRRCNGTNGNGKEDDEEKNISVV
jgi:hypothetical protein